MSPYKGKSISFLKLLPLQGDFVLSRNTNYAEALVPIRASATFTT